MMSEDVVQDLLDFLLVGPFRRVPCPVVNTPG